MGGTIDEGQGVLLHHGICSRDRCRRAYEVTAASEDLLIHEDAVAETCLDVIRYAGDVGVTPRRALERLALQGEAGSLEERLTAKLDEGFSGLWIEQKPDFRIVVGLTAPKETEVRAATNEELDGTGLAPYITFQVVLYSFAQLEADQRTVRSIAKEVGASSMIDVVKNRVILMAEDAAAIERLRGETLPPSVEVADDAYRGGPTALGYAGMPLSNGCTAGFNLVNNNTFKYYTSTAGHCSASFTMNGASITCSLVLYEYSFDSERCSTGGLSLQPWMRVSTTENRTIRNRWNYASLGVGGYMCKYGNTTHQTCGYLESKTFEPSWVPNSNATFLKVTDGAESDLSSGGDSGGPVFNAANAIGIVEGEYGPFWCVCDLIATAIPWAETQSGGGQPRVFYIPY